MNERSARSFTLDYYRSKGARCFPESPENLRWQVMLEGKKLSLNFDPACEEAIVAGSPAWRDVVSCCVDQPTISYRYLSAGVVDPRKLLSEGILRDQVVGKIKLRSATRKLAVGATYRVTYDAPALPAKREELIFHAFDANGDFFTALDESFYSLAILPLDPPEAVDCDWEKIHAKALSRIDEQTALQGEEIEENMSSALSEALERVSSYYGQQRAKAEKEEEREQVDRMEEAAIAEERSRHEVTVSTELAALCAAFYDEVDYLVEVKNNNRSIWTEIAFRPVTGEILLPPCPVCGEHPVEPLFNEKGQFLCEGCAKSCQDCGKLVANHKFLDRCQACGKRLCEGCLVRCRTCGKALCKEHARTVAGHTYCPEHAASCHACGESVAVGITCGVSGDVYCPLCMTTCAVCGKKISKEHALPSPTGCGSICPEHLMKCSCCEGELLEGTAIHCSQCGKNHCSSDEKTCPVCGLSGCSRCVGEDGCTTCRSLGEIEESDGRALKVKEWFPELKPVRWRSSENESEVLVEWTERSGQWGLVAFSKQDRFFRFAYRYGAVSAFFQRMLGRRRKKVCA